MKYFVSLLLASASLVTLYATPSRADWSEGSVTYLPFTSSYCYPGSTFARDTTTPGRLSVTASSTWESSQSSGSTSGTSCLQAAAALQHFAWSGTDTPTSFNFDFSAEDNGSCGPDRSVEIDGLRAGSNAESELASASSTFISGGCGTVPDSMEFDVNSSFDVGFPSPPLTSQTYSYSPDPDQTDVYIEVDVAAFSEALAAQDTDAGSTATARALASVQGPF